MLLTKRKGFDQAWSLRTRLLRILLITLGAGWLLTAFVVGLIVLRTAGKDADAAMERDANLMLTFFEHETREGPGDIAQLAQSYRPLFTGLHFALWDAQDRPLVNFGGAIFDHSADTPRLSFARQDGRQWRVLTVSNKTGDLRLQIAEPATHRIEESRQLAMLMLAALLLALPGMGLIVWVSVARAISPIPHAVAHVIERGPDDLSSIPGEALPLELAPLVAAFNQLLARVSAAFEQARVFAATTAHELRTPLAAIRLNAQLLQREAGAEMPEALTRLIAAVDRTTHLLQQLSTLARIELGALTQTGVESFMLERLVDDTLAELEPIAHQRGISIRSEASAASVRAPLQASYMLLRNLVENAIRYSPPGSRIEVLALVSGNAWRIEVADNGPGLSDRHAGVLRGEPGRPARGDGSGTGLGLAIVRRVADLLTATVEVQTGLDGGGTRIIVSVTAG